MGIVTDLVYIVFAALIGGAIAHRLKQPLLLGYIIAGVIVGPHTAGPQVVAIKDIELLAEVGVGLLLFTVGLEFSFGELTRLKKLTLGVTPAQVILSALIGAGVFLSFGFSWQESVWMGTAAAFSSTMVISKVLSSLRAVPEEGTRSMLGVLIAQDVLVVPILIILPAIAGSLFSWPDFLAAILRAGAFLVGLYLFGTRLFPVILKRVAASRSSELFFLTTITIALGTGFIAHLCGLSFALGAFVAGMLLSETDFSHQALADVSGLKDLFGMVFFVSVGMLIDPWVVYDTFAALFAVTMALILVKGVIIFLMMSVSRFQASISALVSCGLSQVGEFAFVISNVGVARGMLSDEGQSFVIAVAVLSMILTPQLLSIGLRLREKLAVKDALSRGDFEEPTMSAGIPLIIGGGSVGEMLGRGFEATGQNFLIIERDIDRVQQLKALGFQVIFADARYIEKIALNVLESTSIVLITTSERGLSRLIVERIASVRGALPMIVRCQDDEAAEIREIIARVSLIQPQVEAALEMLREALICLGMPSLEAAARIGEWRPQAYGARGVDSLQKNEMQHFQMTRDLDLHWYEVSEQSPLLGAMLKESQLREQYGLMVAAIVRGATVQLSIKPDTVFEQGDVVALLGASRQIADFLEQVRRLTS